MINWRTAKDCNWGDCVEFAVMDGDMIGVRDSKDQDGPVLTWSRTHGFREFVEGAKRGDFDDLL